MNTSSWTRPTRILCEDTGEIKTAWVTELPTIVLVNIPISERQEGSE